MDLSLLMKAAGKVQPQQAQANPAMGLLFGPPSAAPALPDTSMASWPSPLAQPPQQNPASMVAPSTPQSSPVGQLAAPPAAAPAADANAMTGAPAAQPAAAAPTSSAGGYSAWQKSPEGLAYQKKMDDQVVALQQASSPGWKKRLLMGLMFGAQDFGSTMNRGPAVGAENERNWQGQLYGYGQQARELQTNMPGLLSRAYEQSVTGPAQAAAQTRLTGAQATVQENLASNPTMNPQYREFYDGANKFVEGIQQRWQEGDMDLPTFTKWVQTQTATSPYARFLTPELMSRLTSLPQKPPSFKVEGGALQPLVWRGQNFGATAGENEPPEVGHARQAAIQTLQQQLGDKFGPEVLAQLGAPPIGDAKAMADYGHKAEQIKTRMATDPRVAAALARPVQVVLPGGNVGYQGAGDAMHSHAAAPGSIPFQVAKDTAQSAASGKIGDQLQALDTASHHLDTLEQAAQALNNNDVTALNKIANLYGAQTGSTPLYTYNAIKNLVAGDVNKAASAGGVTAEGEMNTVRSVFDSNASMDQQLAAIKATRELMGQKRTVIQQRIQNGEAGVGGGGAPNAGGLQVGASIKLKDGKMHKVTAVHPDGSFDVE